MGTSEAGSQMARLNRATRQLNRENARAERAHQRKNGSEATPKDVAIYRNKVAGLTEFHRISYSPNDWGSVAARGEKEWPKRDYPNATAARRALANYRPGFFARLFGLDQDMRRALNDRVAQETSRDEAAYREAYKIVAAHNAEVEYAVRLLKLELPAVHKALSDHTTYGQIGPAIENVNLSVPARGRLVAKISALEVDDMPDERCEFINGAPAYQPLPRSAMNGLHRANVCSAAIRVAAEVMSAAPVPAVEIIVECDIVDPRSGMSDRGMVLQVKVPHNALVETPPSMTDAVELVTRLGGRMDWSLNEGFKIIEPQDAAGEVAAA